MKTLSLCMIVKDEEKNLDKCLENSQIFADEIIIVDTGSQDKTKEIAKSFTDKVFEFDWIDDFSKARNFSFDKATSEYIIWLDGDDFMTKESAEKIREWKEGQDESDVVMCPYVASYEEDLTPTFEYLRERIVKNKKELRWHDPVHEVIIPSGKITTMNDIKIYHAPKKETYSDRNLNIYKKIIFEGKELSPRQQFYFARELYFNGKIDEAIHEFSKFLSENKGWKENNIEACQNLSKCYQLQKKYENALTSLFGSFAYGVPKGEVLYEIGVVFMEKKEYEKAIYWLKLALSQTPQTDSGAFVNKDCYDFLPSLALCVCYDKLGDLISAYEYHKQAKKIKPNDKSVLFNEKYFNNIFEKK